MLLASWAERMTKSMDGLRTWPSVCTTRVEKRLSSSDSRVGKSFSVRWKYLPTGARVLVLLFLLLLVVL